MRAGVFVTRRRGAAAAAAAACAALLLLQLTQQVCASPLARSGPEGVSDVRGAQALRRTARMSPLWRVMNSKPLGAYCQSNYECSTGLCREGHCSVSQRSPLQIANY